MYIVQGYFIASATIHSVPPEVFVRVEGRGTISVKALQRALYEVHNSRTARLAIERRKQSSGRAGKRDKGD